MPNTLLAAVAISLLIIVGGILAIIAVKRDNLPDFKDGNTLTADDLNRIVSTVRFLKGLSVTLAIIALLVGLLSWQKDGASLGVLVLNEVIEAVQRSVP